MRNRNHFTRMNKLSCEILNYPSRMKKILIEKKTDVARNQEININC